MTNSVFSYLNNETTVPSGLPMVALVTGFADAGGSVSQLNSHIFANFDSELLVQFDNDQLLDYRSRRPSVYFQKDHIAFVEPPVLGVYLVRDEIGQPFLLLDGYEPDFKWNTFTEAVDEIIDFYQVSQFTWIHSVPFPLPHTQPLGVTVSGNRADMIERYSQWKPETQVPGTAIHLLEYRLREIEFPTTGFVFLVPHYLAENEYPEVGLKAFECLTAATGLVFPTDVLRAEAAGFLKKLNARLADNQDLANMVANLEQGFKQGKVGPLGTSIQAGEQQLPSADEIAAQLEDFLTKQNRNEEEN